MIPKKDDSFFQLSLTELAFVLVFVVLLLIGSKIMLMGGDASTCQAALTACDNRARTCEQEKTSCFEAIAKGGNDPNAVIDTLVNAPKLRKENAELQARAQELENELKAFEELRKKVPDPVRAKTAEEFLAGYEKDAKTKIPLDAAKKRGEEAAHLAKELADCRGQLTHCEKIKGGPKGFGLPPCWADNAGQIQYLLNVEIRPDGLKVDRAWPIERNADAQLLPGLQTTLDAGLQSLDQFKANTQAIFDQSKKSNPECRHYVVIRRAPSLRDIDQFNRLRLGVEDYFYKLDRTASSTR